MRILNLKNTVTEIKKLMDGLNSRMKGTEEIMNLRREQQNTQFEQHRENRLKLTESQEPVGI